MCSPSATGSRQANSTIWARWRGGNLLGTPQERLVQQEFLQAALLVAATDTPDGGPITLQAGGDGLDGFPCSNGQHNAGMLDLKEGQVATACHCTQNGSVRISHRQGMRLSATHGIPPMPEQGGGYLQYNRCHEFVALLLSRPTRFSADSVAGS